MVYSLGGSSYPRADLVEGTRDFFAEDPTPDGDSRKIHGSGSGRRVRPDSIPRVVRRYGKRKMLDLEEQYVYGVSARFRDLIEDIEPGVHQFLPVRFIGKGDELIEERWHWQVCNSVDSIDRERSTGELFCGIYRSREGIPWKLLFSLEKIGNVKFWRDKYYTISILITDEVKDRLVNEKITGLRFAHQEQF